jgi:hypothetical protein
MKIFSRIIILISLSILPGCKDEKPVLSAKKIGSTIEIDGIIEKEWNKSSWTQLKNVSINLKGTLRKSDFTSDFKVLWDSSNFYLLIRVIDDVKFRQNLPENKIESQYDFVLWRNDCIEMYFDIGNEKLDSLDRNDFMFRFVYNLDSITSSANANVEGVKLVQKDSPAGYIFEIAIPWKNLNVRPAANKEVGFEITAIDNDNDIIEPDVISERETLLSWAEKEDYTSWRKTDNYGVLKLSE